MQKISRANFSAFFFKMCFNLIVLPLLSLEFPLEITNFQMVTLIMPMMYVLDI